MVDDETTNQGEEGSVDTELAKEVAEFEKEFTSIDDSTDDGVMEAEQTPVDTEVPQEEQPPEAATEVAPPDEPTEATEEPKPKLYTVPDDAVYGDLRGQKATAEQLEAAGLLEKLFTREHQELHHVKLYQDLKREVDGYREEQQRSQAQADAVAQAAAQPKVMPDEHVAELQRTYMPGLTSLANQGAFEEDFLTVYPKVSAQLEHRFQSGGLGLLATIDQVTKMNNTLNEVMEFVGMQQQQQQAVTGRATVEEKLDALSTDLPGLANEEVRGRFIDWAIAEDNTITAQLATKEISDITPEEIRGAFAAYVAMTGDGIPKRQPAENTPARMAGSGTAASRGSSPPGGAPLSEVERFEREFLESQG